MGRKSYSKLLKARKEQAHSDSTLKDDMKSPRLKWKERSYLRAAGEDFRIVVEDLTDEPRHPIRRAFSQFKLDYASPFHWQYLMEHFAELHFNTARSGRKKTLTAKELRSIKKDYELLMKEQPQIKNKLEAAGALKKKWPEKYLQDKSSVRRLLTKAGVLRFPKKAARKSKPK